METYPARDRRGPNVRSGPAQRARTGRDLCSRGSVSGMSLLSLALALALQGPIGSAPAPAVSAANLAEVVAAVLPDPEELAWRTIPWRATLRDGVLDAVAERKPVLLWAMNGHPLGTT